jgi:hypothetical protein
MQNDSVIDFQRALEALRSGVPNRDAVKVLGSNQAEVEKLFRERLAASQREGQQGKHEAGLLIAGGFNTGKSHLLEYLEHVAISENFVCSRIVISKETDYTLKTVKLKDLSLQWFIFASHLILAAGYSGWVLLFDEIELIGRYSLLQRGKSYAELARWLGEIQGESLPGFVAVAAITDDFGLAVLQEKSDRDTIGPTFRSKRTGEYTIAASRAETGMRLIERSVVPLRLPDPETLRRTYERLKEIHRTAYSWNPPEIPPLEMSVTRRMRSYVRRWVNEWDLRRLYPGTNIVTDDEQEIKPTYEPDKDLEVSSEPEEEN